MNYMWIRRIKKQKLLKSYKFELCLPVTILRIDQTKLTIITKKLR
jgi:hypothetical protein